MTGRFETILVRDGRARRLGAHLDRLYLLPAPGRPREEVEAECAERAAAAAGPARMRVVADGEDVLVTVEPFSGYPPALYESGAVAALASPSGHPLGARAGMKVWPYDRMTALRESARAGGAVDLVLRDRDGALLEGTASNLFCVRAGTLLTPPLTRPILPGVTRAAALAAATRLGIPVRETDLHPADVARADEAFLTGSLMEVLPLARLGATGLRPGPVARALGEAISR